jgi:hypothetical protein
MAFDFEGTFTSGDPCRIIEYALDDGRKVAVRFLAEGVSTTIVETFEAENELSGEQQRQGWRSILANFKKHAEAYSK